MNKISITVCLGTTCHLMGSSHLQSISQDLPPSIKDSVEIKWERCLGNCNSGTDQAPIVLVNDEVLHDATLPKIIEKVEELLQKSK